MEEANIGKRKICNRDEESSPLFGIAVEERTIVCCFFEMESGDEFGIYAADIRDFRVKHICRLHIDGPPMIRGCGYGAVGSRIYRIGGVKSDEEKLYPRDVFYCDLFYKNDTICCTNWERGPSLIAGMPHPMAVTVNDKIYALAGSIGDSTGEKLHRNCLFQVLDLSEQPPSWKPLPAPPFFCFRYQLDGFYVPRVVFRTVLGNRIFLRVDEPPDNRPPPFGNEDGDTGDWEKEYLFSFDTDANIWKSHGASTAPSSSSSSSLPQSLSSLLSHIKLQNNILSSSDSSSSDDESLDEYHLDDLIVDNLRVRNWLPYRADPPIDNKLYKCVFHCWEKGTKVFAFDLASKIEDYMIKDEDDDYEFRNQSSYYPFYKCNIEPLPVRGLAQVTNSIPKSRDNLITHIGKNRFLLIVVVWKSITDIMHSCIMHSCTFEVTDEVEEEVSDEEPQVPGHCLYAKDVKHRFCELDSDIYRFSNIWCKLQDLGYPLDSSPFKKCERA